jgi:hypothetical protein
MSDNQILDAQRTARKQEIHEKLEKIMRAEEDSARKDSELRKDEAQKIIEERERERTTMLRRLEDLKNMD